MDMNLEIGVFLAYACGFFVIVFFGKLLKAPLRIIWRLVFNSFAGFVFIFVLNSIFGGMGFWIPLNCLNAVILGILGVPGLIMLAVFTLLHI